MSATNDNLKQMYQDSLLKQKSLKLDLDNYDKKKNTNERKVYYELGNIDNVTYYNKLLKVLYFIILGIYILFGPFISGKQYFNPLIWVSIITYVCLPFVLSYIVNFVFDIINMYKQKKAGHKEYDDDKPISSCFLLNTGDTNLEEEVKDTGDTTIVAPPLLVEKCYVRFDGEQCKKHPTAGWSGWKPQTTYTDCYNCDGTTQTGCDAIKNQWSTYCGNNAFDVFTADAPPSLDVCT